MAVVPVERAWKMRREKRIDCACLMHSLLFFHALSTGKKATVFYVATPSGYHLSAVNGGCRFHKD
jgi:hypothetical protein